MVNCWGAVNLFTSHVEHRGNGGKMQNYFSAPFEMFNTAAHFMGRSMKVAPKLGRAAFAQAKTAQDYWYGMFKYVDAFMGPSVNALNAFVNAEKVNLVEKSPSENLKDYSELFNLNLRLASTAMAGSLRAMNAFFYSKLSEGLLAYMDTLTDDDSFGDFSSRLEETLKVAVHEYPVAIEEIKAEYGFHLDSPAYVKVAETDRFDLYQVLPAEKNITARSKPILIIPPYVLGANILAFLPGEQRSYVHCYANQGIPTYIRIIKDIHTNPAVQTMTGEDDALDLRFFCRELVARHNRPVTLNGFCQGGYHALAALLAGELEDLVDALITCATPVDGSRSKTLAEYMMSLPPRFRDIRYSCKVLPNGNTVIDGRILGWVYKLRKLEAESPIASFHRDISMFDSQNGQRKKISKTAAAVNHWLTHDQQDIPLGVTKMSFDSYSIPIDAEGTLPVTLFGRKLNLKRLEEKKVPWLICIAESDDIVEKDAALAALDYIDAEVCVFPKGHASLATSWSVPTSECALHLRFCVPSLSAPGQDKMCRGPVCFQIDMDTSSTIKATGPFSELRAKQKEEQQVPESLVAIPDHARAVGEEEKIGKASRKRPLALVLPAAKAAKKAKPGQSAPTRRPSGKSASSKNKLP